MKSANPVRNPAQLMIAAGIGLSAAALGAAPAEAAAPGKPAGKYVSGDFHNHTTCSDGSISMQKLVKKSVDSGDGNYGLDWFVQAGHGGSGNRNCTLAEDESLATPAYPYRAGVPAGTSPPATTWINSGVTPKGNVSGTGANRVMWRWQSIQEFQYPLLEHLAALKNRPLFIGVETVVPGHEHTSMSVITGQMPAQLDTQQPPTSPGYTALGNANALAQWEYCFDRNDTDTSRGVTSNWDCSVPGSANASDPNWIAAGFKLGGAGNSGEAGHRKTLEALKWMNAFHPEASYYVPAHLERAGPFNPLGSNGFNVEHLRNMNNVAPRIAFGFESQPGHGASDNRGEYSVRRQTINGVPTDSVGGSTYGGTGIYAAQVGGVWDALLGEGRNWWFFASSDWHNRGNFNVDDVRSSQDFYPGEYQRTHVLVRNAADKIRPQSIVDALRSGNAYATSGDLIDRLAFVACVSYRGIGARSDASVEAIALSAAVNDTDTSTSGCATMGEKLTVRPGADIVVTTVLRDPAGTNVSPYVFNNPSLLQVGVRQPLNAPVLDHVDVIRGLVTGYRQPGSPDYAGAWPVNTAWLRADGTTPSDLSGVPAAAKNTSAAVIKTFSKETWTPVVASDGTTYLKMTFRIPAVNASQYVRLRGTNLQAGVPFETDAGGNPLADEYTNTRDTSLLRIPCTLTGNNVPTGAAIYTARDINGCPSHLATATGASPIAGTRAVSFDVAAWADLWFYGNPIYVEVQGGQVVAGVN